MTPLEQHQLISKVLWALKVPEVALTIVLVPGFVLWGLGVIEITIPLYAFLLRLTLFFIRLGIVKVKRDIEKKYNIARTTYTPTIIKKGTKKVEFIKYKREVKGK
jgi:hypothetical protein